MVITDIVAAKIKHDFLEPMTIALGEMHSADIVVVKVETDAGITGYGEGSSLPFVTGESADITIAAIDVLRGALTGRDPLDARSIHEAMERSIVRNGTAKAAIDLAVFDIIGKKNNLPLYRLLGAAEGVVETDITLGIDEPAVMAEKARLRACEGFRQIKIKAGASWEDDIRAVRLIREAVGPKAKLKIDANQGWTAKQALDVIESIGDCDIDAIEQPLPWWDFAGMAHVRAHSGITIMADESCFNVHDAERIARENAADMINIKLMKCGGLFPAMAINSVAERAALKCMIGCMAETRTGIAAAAALASAKGNIVYADLDGFLVFRENKRIDGGFTFDTPWIKLSDKPGLGVEVDF
ncbi:MAG: dipeptide epimerase [Clostridiales Family XIII bacterium]|jgi:L-alanine-DL-glutamate epimerase-like enolase superfamily enzyme|nr:dipeptide epimerase [Clostridiales Family XIII bacterium]